MTFINLKTSNICQTWNLQNSNLKFRERNTRRNSGSVSSFCQLVVGERTKMTVMRRGKYNMWNSQQLVVFLRNIYTFAIRESVESLRWNLLSSDWTTVGNICSTSDKIIYSSRGIVLHASVRGNWRWRASWIARSGNSIRFVRETARNRGKRSPLFNLARRLNVDHLLFDTTNKCD